MDIALRDLRFICLNNYDFACAFHWALRDLRFYGQNELT